MLVRVEEQYIPMRILEINAANLDDAYNLAMGSFKVNKNKLLDRHYYIVIILEN